MSTVLTRQRERDLIDERLDDEVELTRARPNRGMVFLGWLLRIAVGGLLCANYFTGVIVAGWFARRMRGVSIRHWWRHGESARNGENFEAYVERFGPAAPSARPGFFLHRRPMMWVNRGEPGGFRKAVRFALLPFVGLWANIVAGVRITLGTTFLMGWGLVLVWLGWEFGWHNSFNKGYEQAFFGIGLSLIGLAMFAAAMVYVPIAQAHIALTNDIRSALDFRFLRRLIRCRMLGYTLLVACTGLAWLPVWVMGLLPSFFPQMDGWFDTATDAEVRAFMGRYLVGHAFVTFGMLFLLRRWTACLYASGTLEALRRGEVTEKELHPEVRLWLKRLNVEVEPRLSSTGVLAAAGTGGRWVTRRVGFVMIWVVWLAVMFSVLVSQFFNYRPVIGFLNQPLIQLPCPSYVPNGGYTEGV